jgi:hypothetical protein
MNEVSSGYEALEGGTLDFLYGAGSSGLFASPTYAPSNYSPSLSYTSEASVDGFDSMSIDPKLTNEFDDLFGTQIPFTSGSDLCLNTPPLDYSKSI